MPEAVYRGFWQADVTQWGMKGSLRRISGSGCDAVECERQFKRISRSRCDAVGCEKQFRRIWESECDVVGCERQFRDDFGRRM